MEYRDNRPWFEHGLGVDRICFSGGRLALDLVRHGGITRINYYGKQRFGDVVFFQSDALSAWSLLFRPMICFDQLRRYVLEFHDTTIYPTGYVSHCRFEGISFRHEMWLDNEEMIFRLLLLSPAPDRPIEFQLINTDICTRIDKATRQWERLDNEIPLFKITDHYSDEAVAAEKAAGYLTLAQRGDPYVPQIQTVVTHLALVGTQPIKWMETPRIFRKYYASQTVAGAETFFILGFGHQGQEELLTRLQTRKTLAGQGFAVPAASGASVACGQPDVQSFLMNAGEILDSLKVKDLSGGIRAADSGYWIWGWDGMVYADAHGWLNQSGFIAQMLDFYRRTADSRKGIFHEMTIDGRPYLSMAFPAQCLYAVMLYWGYIFDGSKELLREYLPFAEELVRRAGENEVAGTGLIRGVALYPDHPEDLEQDGQDLSVFNNSIYYQALRVLEALCRELGAADRAEQYKNMAARTCGSFEKFYDPEQGYFCDSLSARDFSRRNHWPIYAILEVTPFARDLAGSHLDRIAEYTCREFSARQGCRILPLSDSRFMYDGNQLGMYMPATEHFFRSMHNYSDPVAARAKFYDDIAWNWSKLTLPEALTCEYENHGLTPDNPGRKQTFTVKSWVAGFYRLAVGISLSTTGIGFEASADRIKLVDLILRGRRIAIENTGCGVVLAIYLNGRKLASRQQIAFFELDLENHIIVERADVGNE